ncbi:hypothetical protein, partial [Geminocystis sp. GBBB08]|uniref:hypothetical protein n=1 Tax=Geminocystis sp. GBBB08 TaxID=2604140 RepID=UPI00292834AC|nr:hypothetical protein [Geminocystis sp. GBBB08]
MIPILSSALIATNTHNLSVSEVMEIDSNQSHLVIAEENIIPIDSQFSNIIPSTNLQPSTLVSQEKLTSKNLETTSVNYSQQLSTLVSQEKLTSKNLE